MADEGAALGRGHILVVTGARALSGAPQSIAWARAHLEQRIGALPQDAWVLSGRCPHAKNAQGNVDLWAVEIAQSRGLRTLELALDGYAWVDGRRTTKWPVPKMSGCWPFKRNAAEVRRARGAMDKGFEVRALCFLHAGAPCRGSRHTRRLAEEAGILVETMTFGG